MPHDFIASETERKKRKQAVELPIHKNGFFFLLITLLEASFTIYTQIQTLRILGGMYTFPWNICISWNRRDKSVEENCVIFSSVVKSLFNKTWS